ncbi:hypothetical protein MKS88_003525 [Plasmodium brasilianum]|uniref:Uncharacterized protein n=2 Tax=Plasmodium (Plasmodium) TaxID=418103 RepID=A0A1A8W3U5_PLAMA|nr:conserved Plasmodium protein, unknown function [Plasmodium malariae]KAI4837058.1 hypothetical protein MKS88_003525 [Plasmodium brasilianum]SBS86651.1 conserved Plasmodium protein, unknown function [Plasmodium malariae]SCO92937.1 conserved Plasmodium protein, unknown function [Plasmodium malariae]
MNGFKARTNSKSFRYFNRNKEENSGNKTFSHNNKNGNHNSKKQYKEKNRTSSVEEISEYLINISYILNEKYEKYFVYELKEENLKKGNKAFGSINLEYSYYLEDDISILIKIKEEIKNNVEELMNNRKCSKIMEKLIYYCFFLLKYNEKNVKNSDISIQCIKIYNNFFHVIKRNFVYLAISSYASHFVQTVICVFPFFNKYEDIYIEEIKKRNKNYVSISSHFNEICNGTVENMFTLMFDKSGTHVLRSFLYSLGGYLSINISNITFRKSKARKSISKRELKYIDKGCSSSCNGSNTDSASALSSTFYSYIYKIIDRITDEIMNPKETQNFKNLLYQYIFYDIYKGNNNKLGKDEKSDEKYSDESKSQYLISPLLYNTYSVPALGTLFELIKDKNVECSNLLSEILVIERTKKYYMSKACENCCGFDICPLKQVLDILIKLDGPSIMVEKLLKINHEHIFYVFNIYIIKNINSLICDNAYSNLVMYNYLNCDYITEEMFDLLIKNVDIDMVIKRRKFNVLKGLFDLAQYYKRNCKLLFNSLIRGFNVGGLLSTVESGVSGSIDGIVGRGVDSNVNGNNGISGSSSGAKFLWICILCMCRYEDLHPCIRNVFKNEKKVEADVGRKKIDKMDDKKGNEIIHDNFENDDNINLNNYNFYNYLKIDIYGYNILSHLLSFPKECIVPLINSFKHFCNFFKIVSNNKPRKEDIERYKKFAHTFSLSNKDDNNNDGYNNDNNGDGYNENNKQYQIGKESKIENCNNTEHVHNGVSGSNSWSWNNYNDPRKENKCNGKMQNEKEKKKGKPFVRRNTELRGNILLYFSCDKILSHLCEKIAHTFNLINEKHLRHFLLLFKNEYKHIATNYIGAHIVVTFFKLGNNNIKKRILDQLVENDINVYNSYIRNFMKLKEYKKNKIINNTCNNKYTKAKKLFEDILIPKEKESIGDYQNKESYVREDMKKDQMGDEDSQSDAPASKDVTKNESFDLEKEYEDDGGKIYDQTEVYTLLKHKKEKKKRKRGKILSDRSRSKENDLPTLLRREHEGDGVEKGVAEMEGKRDHLDGAEEKDKNFMNVISDFIKNSKNKTRKRKKEREGIEQVLKKCAVCA